MNKLLAADANILALTDFIQSQLPRANAKLDSKHSHLILKTPNRTPTSKEEKIFGHKILKFMQSINIKNSINTDPYAAYLSLIDTDDIQQILQNIMFGRHIAEIHPLSKDRAKNPFIPSKAIYHRSDEQSGRLFAALKKTFSITESSTDQYEYIPVIPLKTITIEELIINNFPKTRESFKVIKNDNNSIIMLAIDKNCKQKLEIKKILRAVGIIASPWEIAINAQLALLELKDDIDDKEPTVQNTKISLNSNLPKTREGLLKSSILTKLRFIASNEKYTSNKLAACIEKMLIGAPKLTPEAIQRIAIIIDITITFYAQNYPRFAFCVYTIIHEISLALINNSCAESKDHDYDNFYNESKETLLHALNLKNFNNSHIIATPAMSGTNAYAIALKLAAKMQIKFNQYPTINIIKPSYYEFDYITKSTTSINADIFILTCGPVTTKEGLVPGADINQFVRKNIINTARTKPTTIILDATTALYKNIRLDEDVAKLVENGELSIIIHESHQKFGLIHSDQAQYGRMFAICAKSSFLTKDISTITENAKIDFKKYIDLRIGAFININCRNLLEEIKHIHFTNGAILKSILTKASLSSPKEIVSYEGMLTNLDELYFITSAQPDLNRATSGKITVRDSFGHFATSKIGININQSQVRVRLSPDASDNIDCLIQASQIYLAKYFKPVDLLKFITTNTRKIEHLKLADQILYIAILNSINITTCHNYIAPLDLELEMYAALNNILAASSSLKGRQYFTKPINYMFTLRNYIKDKYTPDNIKSFFKAVNVLYENNITIPKKFINKLSKNTKLCDIINLFSNSLLTERLLKTLTYDEKKLDIIHENLIHLESCLPLITKLQRGNIYLNINSLIKIITNSNINLALNILCDKKIKITNNEIRAMDKNPKLTDFIIELKVLLSETQYKTAAAISSVVPDFSEYHNLIHDEDFSKAILKIYDVNLEILSNLKNSPKKYSKALTHSPIYLISCFQALKIFANSKKTKDDKDKLIEILDTAKDRYCVSVLSKDRSNISKTIRIMLMAVTNFIAALSFGIIHYKHFKTTGRVLFFSETNSSIKLQDNHRDLANLRYLTQTN